jgi:hypothetical protein
MTAGAFSIVKTSNLRPAAKVSPRKSLTMLTSLSLYTLDTEIFTKPMH